MKERIHVAASIIIPAFNEAKTIVSCLDAICTGEFTDFEIIVVNDASSDATAHLVEGYNDPRVGLISNASRQGAAYSMNQGVKLAKSDLLLFINADCFAQPQWAGNAVQSLSKESVCAVEGATHYLGSHTRIWQKVPLNPFYNLSCGCKLTVPGQDFASGNFATKRRHFERINGFNSNRYPNGREDTDLGMRLLKRGEIKYNPEMAVLHQAEVWTYKSLLENARRYSADVRIYKDHGNFPYRRGRILHPRLLFLILFPPLIFVYYEVCSLRALGFIPKFMLYLVCLRLVIWKTAVTERILLV